MKIVNIIYISIALLLAQSCFAQYVPAKVVISNETVNIKGALFYLHKVKEQQTLYSIAKAYNTDIESIVNNNPALSTGLKEGTIIYIKVENITEEAKEEVIKTEPISIINSDTLSQYQAQHIVKWYESLSSIAKKYEVTEEEIGSVNALINNKVQTRQVLNIPFAGSIKYLTKLDTLSEQVIYPDQPNEKDIAIKSDLFKRGRYNNLIISVLLPLGGPAESTIKRNHNESNNFIEFYQGFLLALEDIKKVNYGINLKIRVVDTDNYANSRSIVESGILEMSNLIIGPVFTENMEPILRYANQQGIYVVSPMDPTSEHFANDYSNFYQVSTPVSYQQRGILSAVNLFSDVTLIFEDTGAKPDALVNITQEILESGRIRYNTLSYNILKGRSILPNIEEQLKQDKVNHVIVASNSEAFVSDVLRNLNLLKSRRDYNIVVYGTPRWRSFETIDINYYHGMNLNISMQYYVDYNRDNIKEFLSKFRAIYNSEPSPYAFQAYDIAGYFISNMWKHGRDFINNTQNYKMEMLHSDYNFIRLDNNGGYINTAIRRVIYKPDYSTSDIRGFFR